MRSPAVLAGLVALFVHGWPIDAARAAENATGIYLLGIKTSMAGFVPPPGTYVTDINYAYSGDASGAAAVGVALRRTGILNVQADIDVTGNAYINLAALRCGSRRRNSSAAMSAWASWSPMAGRMSTSVSMRWRR